MHLFCFVWKFQLRREPTHSTDYCSLQNPRSEVTYKSYWLISILISTHSKHHNHTSRCSRRFIRLVISKYSWNNTQRDRSYPRTVIRFFFRRTEYLHRQRNCETNGDLCLYQFHRCQLCIEISIAIFLEENWTSIELLSYLIWNSSQWNSWVFLYDFKLLRPCEYYTHQENYCIHISFWFNHNLQ